MDLMLIFKEAFWGSLQSIGQIAMIVIPLMVFIEIIKDLDLLRYLTAAMKPLTSRMKLSEEAGLPLAAGLTFGLSYGGGIIIHSAQQGTLTYREIFMTNLFLVICHSLFEDTILFAVIGAQWVPVLIFRVLLAVVVCLLAAHFWPESGERTFSLR